MQTPDFNQEHYESDSETSPPDPNENCKDCDVVVKVGDLVVTGHPPPPKQGVVQVNITVDKGGDLSNGSASINLVPNQIKQSNTKSLPQSNQNAHRYVIRVPNNCSASDSFWALQQPNMSAPGAPAAQTANNVQLWGNGGHNLINQTVDSASMTITNVTQPGHQFYPGQVVMQVTPNGSGSIVTITGTGNGPNPVWNDIIGYAFFGSMAENLAIGCGAPGN